MDFHRATVTGSFDHLVLLFSPLVWRFRDKDTRNRSSAEEVGDGEPKCLLPAAESLVGHGAFRHFSESAAAGVLFGQCFVVVGLLGGELSPAFDTPGFEFTGFDRNLNGATGLS